MDELEAEAWERFRKGWELIGIRRRVEQGLFTFGQSDLPYYLVLAPDEPGELTSVLRGEVKVDRARILTPDNYPPELQDFFESADDVRMMRHMLARTANFRHLRLRNSKQAKQLTSDCLDEAVDRLNRRLDDEEDERTAILTAPIPFAGLAVLRYATERILRSAPDNIQELRERGFLP